MTRIASSLLALTLLVTGSMLHAQAVIEGIITNSANEPEFGANIIIDKANGLGTATDFDGLFSIEVEPGTYEIIITSTGKKEVIKTIEIGEEETVTINESLEEDVTLLTGVEVNAGKFDQPLGEVTVSLTVLSSESIENSNPTDMEEALNKTPGVTVVDGQANIRSGSGWTYGAGSRVLILLDDLPLLTADAASAQWTFMPMESIEQVDVIKGASSSLYGASALNGVINLRTAVAKAEPYTKFTVFGTIIDKPKDESQVWWDSKTQPFTTGASFTHRQRFGNLDLVSGGRFYDESSYLKEEYNKYGRLNANLRYRFQKVEGLSAGINTNVFSGESATFILWNGRDELSLIPFTNSVGILSNKRATVDPFVKYIASENNTFEAKGRWLHSDNKSIDSFERGSTSNLFYYEIGGLSKIPSADLKLAYGFVNSYSIVRSELFSNVDGNMFGAYVQATKKIGEVLNIDLGARYELHTIDTFESDLKRPLFRLGLSYQLAEATYLRGSFGEGYRFPSIAERFVDVSAGSVNVFKNPRVLPERAWGGEVGIRQGFAFGEGWIAFLDGAVFINEFQDMIEFTFGEFGVGGAVLDRYGFSAQNIGQARTAGLEVNGLLNGKIFGYPFDYTTGYTYVQPTALNWEETFTTYDENGDVIVQGTGNTTYEGTSSSSPENILKYRFKHIFRGDFNIDIDKLKLGVTAQYLSYMENIDNIFTSQLLINNEGSSNSEAFSGLKSYREEHDGEGDWVFEARAAYEITDDLKTAVIVKNVFNEEYMLRPTRINAPRNFTLQVSYEIPYGKKK